MEKKIETTNIVGCIGTTIRIHSFIPSSSRPAVRSVDVRPAVPAQITRTDGKMESRRYF